MVNRSYLKVIGELFTKGFEKSYWRVIVEFQGGEGTRYLRVILGKS